MRELIHPGQLAGHTAVVVGAGRSGLAAARLLTALGAGVRILERGEPSAEARELAENTGVAIEKGDHTARQFADADIVVLSPGINARGLGEALRDVPERKIVAELELASWFVTEPVIAVTGTSGKSTTVSLIAHMLRHAGKKVFLGGNIGTPLSDYVVSGEVADVVVIEVSSFQLMHVRALKPHVAVLVNIAPNHLDFHDSMEEYYEAKLRLFARMNDQDLAILPLELKDDLEKREFTHARRVYFVPTNRFPDAPLVGFHNQADMEAAYLACRAFGVSQETAADSLATFEPLPHRLQPVAEKGGVLFVDDSKATTLDAMAAALRSFDRPVRLLLGGVFKGGDVAAVAPLVAEKAVSVGLFGGSREIFEDGLSGRAPLFWEESLAKAVARHYREAAPGDVILLSPATSSFDQYVSYAARGEDFKKAVEELKE